jgi:hypothetical protein
MWRNLYWKKRDDLEEKVKHIEGDVLVVHDWPTILPSKLKLLKHCLLIPHRMSG